METTVHAYNFDTSKAADKAAYTELSARLKAQGLEVFKTWGGKGDGHGETGRKLDGREVALETEHLFDNQWNTAPIDGIYPIGVRLFDWAEDAIFCDGRENLTLRYGYYLNQTDAMRAARAGRAKCGYCGKQYAALGAPVFCDSCLHSPYLAESDLRLLRLHPVTDSIRRTAPELTDAERADLLPRYMAAQLHGKVTRDAAELAKLRARVEAKVKEAELTAERLVRNAYTERDGLRWMLDRGLHGLIENTIFYDHTGRFCFGWRHKLDKARTDALLDAISEFPYPYDIDTDHRGKLSGG